MCVLSTFSDPRAGRCPGCPRGENGTLPAACPDPSSFHRPAKAHPPLSICPAGGIFNRPIRAGAAPPHLPVFRFLATFSPARAPSLPRRALPLVACHRAAFRFPSNAPGAAARPLVFRCPAPCFFSAAKKHKSPCRRGGRGISEKFRDGGRTVPDATPAYRMRTRITPFVPARARAVSSLGQEAMSMSV